MAYYEAKLKSKGNKTSPCFRPLRAANASDKYLFTRTMVQVSFKHIWSD